MGVQVNGDLKVLLEGLDQVIGIVRGDKAGLVFDTYGISAHVLEDERFLDEVFQVVDGPAHPGLGE